MPINAGTATPTFRLGTAAVSRMYLGSVSVFDAAGTGTGGGGGSGTIPYGLSVVAGDASVVLRFQCATGPTSFQIQYSTNNGAVWTVVPSGYTYSQTVASGVITGTATIGSLTNGSTYVFRVAGVSTAGIGTYSSKSPAAVLNTTPTVPSGVTAAMSGDDTYVIVSWTASTGSSALRYLIQQSSDGGTTWTEASRIDGGVQVGLNSSHGLIPGSSYKFRVAATYVPRFLVAGTSEWVPVSAYSSATASLTVTQRTPLEPSLSVEPTTGGVVVTVDPPQWNGGATITEHRVYVYDATTSRPGSPTHTISGATGGTVSSTGLTNGTAYKVDVCAVNSVGAGDFATTTVTPLASIPPQVPALTITCGTATAVWNNGTFEWRSPATVQWASSGYSSRPTPPLFEVEYRASASPTWIAWLYGTSLNSVASPPYYYATINVVPGISTVFRVREVDGAQKGPWRYETATCSY